MTAYDLARQSHRFEPGRLNRALGLAQRRETVILDDGRIDIPSASDNGFHLVRWDAPCDCEDFHQHMKFDPNMSGGKSLKPVRLWNCQHRIAFALVKRAWEIEAGSGSHHSRSA